MTETATDRTGAENPRVVLTERAAQVVREAFGQKGVDPESACLRVGARPGGCSGYRYEMDYAHASQVTERDVVFTSHGIRVVVEATCLQDILGSVEIGYLTGTVMERGFRFRPFAEQGVCGCGESFAPQRRGA